MAAHTTLPEDESVESYDLDVDIDEETTELDREAAIRAAVEAVERIRRPGDAESETPAEAARAGETEATAAEEEAPPGEDPRLQLERELAEVRERSLRTLADFENYRRRAEREREEARRASIAEPLREFLDVIDNLERALDSKATGAELAVGVEMILKQMKELTRRFGVAPVEALSEAFDPALHEAVARNEDPGVEVPTVVQELQRGYVMRDRLLRPSRVVVAVPPERSEGSEEPAASAGDGPEAADADSGGREE